MKDARFFWFLPLETDVKYIGTLEPEGREPSIQHLVNITNITERFGFEGLLVPTSYALDLDTWIASTAALSNTKEAKVIIAVRPNQLHPAQAAKMVHSLHTLFPGRVALNVLTGKSGEDAWIGNNDSGERRHRRAREWLEIVKGIWYGKQGEPFSYQGQVYSVSNNELEPKLDEPIEIFLSGGSKEAQQLAAEKADTYLLFGSTLKEVESQVKGLRKLHPHSRLEIGLRMHIIVRETEDEAWEAANEMISKVDPIVREYILEHPHYPSLGPNAKERIQNNDLMIEPHLWGGIGTARLGNGTAIVGSTEQVMDKLTQYYSLGVRTFILSSYPKLEEAKWVGELLEKMFCRYKK
jgi:alkanesulfonate monooxygenase